MDIYEKYRNNYKTKSIEVTDRLCSEKNDNFEFQGTLLLTQHGQGSVFRIYFYIDLYFQFCNSNISTNGRLLMLEAKLKKWIIENRDW